MSVVVYRCSVCKREIDVRRQTKGIEVVDRCIITHGCRGHLQKVKLHPDFIRGRPLVDIVGLDNWLQRIALFDHIQSIRRTKWVIKHNMGGNPSVQVFVDRPTTEDPDNREEIIPDNIILVSDDEIRIEFIEPESGIAQLIARSTDPLLAATTVTSAPVEEVPTQVSSNGTITIVTRIPAYSAANVSLELIYKNANNNMETTILEPLVDDQPSILSPWRDVNTVIIKGTRYVVRSLNILRPEMATGVILDGAGVRLSTINTNPLAPEDVFLLLGKSPFTIFDKDVFRIIDMADITATSNTFSLFFSDAEWRAKSIVIQSIFPFVKNAA